MAKPSTSALWIYVTVAIILLVILSFAPHRPHRPNRRLKLRSSAELYGNHAADHHRRVRFDPLIADIERHRDDREWERVHYFSPPATAGAGDDHAPAMESQPEWEDFMDAEDYINDEDRFNVSDRIVQLFPKIDVAPVDGFVSGDELTEWNLEMAMKDVMHRTRRDLEIHDKNHDGFIAFSEYEPPSWAIRFHDSNSTQVGWWKEEHFNASDVDDDGLLNLTEFNDFLHPADTSNPKLIHWLCKEEIRERDKDKDGVLNFQEFFTGLFDSIRNYDEVYNATHESDDISKEAPAKQLFSQLDKDKDGYLSADELKSVIGELHPSERYYAKQQADYLVSQADMDKDGRLTLTEMIENPYVFYSAIFSDDDDFSYHDEFR